jgi:hypothetical protein
MKIEGLENICNIFSIFHDGEIIHCKSDSDSLFLEVEIQYLTEKVASGFRKSTTHIAGVKNIHFSTWPRDLRARPELLFDVNKIFKSELEIWEGKTEEEQILVSCKQHSPNFDYSGGKLFFSASSAEVTDEAGKSYSFAELETLFNSYWNNNIA